jgi:hypothetical protein
LEKCRRSKIRIFESWDLKFLISSSIHSLRKEKTNYVSMHARVCGHRQVCRCPVDILRHSMSSGFGEDD